MPIEGQSPDFYHQSKKIEWEQSGFPTNPWERTGLLLNSAINLGPKSVIIMMLPGEGEYLPIEEMGRSFRNIVRGSDTYYDSLSPSVVAQFCRESLADIGMVARAVDVTHATESVVVGYGLTRAGEIYGRRAAALALDFEYEHPDISIYTTVGQTSTSSNNDFRAPMHRSQLLLELYKRNSRWSPMAEIQSFSSYLAGDLPPALDVLVKNGMVERDKEEKPHRAAYVMGSEQMVEVPAIRHRVRITEDLVHAVPDVLKEHGYVTADLMSRKLQPGYIDTLDPQVLKDEVSRILHILSEKKYLMKNMERVANDPVLYKLTKSGATVVTQLIHPLYMVMQDNREFIQTVDTQVVSEVRARLPEYAREAVRRYYPHSRAAQIQRMKELDGEIMKMLDISGPDGVSIRDLELMAGEHTQSVVNRLNRKIRSGAIRKIDHPLGPRYVRVTNKTS